MKTNNHYLSMLREIKVPRSQRLMKMAVRRTESSMSCL